MMGNLNCAQLLNAKQLDEYQGNGLIFFSNVFSNEEISALRDELELLLGEQSPVHLRAASGELLGTTVMHLHSELYRRLISDERLVTKAEQILGGAVYVHQYKVILKEPFGSLSLPWHQDYGPWLHHDGMPEPKALSFGIFLDDVTQFNGPIAYIPGSHRDGLIPYQVQDVPGTTPIPSLSAETVTNLVAERAIETHIGEAGSMTLFDCCTAHASGINISPQSRRLIYLSYNLVSNAIQKPTRAEHFAARDFTPLNATPAKKLLRN